MINRPKGLLENGTGRLPLPATQQQYSRGGREGERAGAASAARRIPDKDVTYPEHFGAALKPVRYRGVNVAESRASCGPVTKTSEPR